MDTQDGKIEFSVKRNPILLQEQWSLALKI